MWIRLPRPCGLTCRLCTEPFPLLKRPFFRDDVNVRLKHASETAQHGVFLQQDEEEILDSYVVNQVTSQSRGRVWVIGEPHQLKLDTNGPPLSKMGINNLYATVHGSSATTHDLRARKKGLWPHILNLFASAKKTTRIPVGANLELTARNLEEIPALIEVLNKVEVPELLLSEYLPRTGEDDSWRPSPEALLRAIDRAWRAAQGSRLQLRLLGFARLGSVTAHVEGRPPVFDANLLELLRHGVQPPSVKNGVVAFGPGRAAASTGRELERLGFELAAHKTPLLDVPPCLGGVLQVDKPSGDRAKSETCRHCALDEQCAGLPANHGLSDGVTALVPPRLWTRPKEKAPRVLILSGEGTDQMLYASTLPGLAHGLRQRGANVEMVSPWAAAWKPDGTFQGSSLPWKQNTGVEQWLAANELAPFDIIIAADFNVVRMVLDAGKLASHTRLHVADAHMLRDVEKVAKRRASGDSPDAVEWPTEQLFLESGFPSYVHLYVSHGVPLRQVSWRPVSIFPGHFPPGPSPETCATIMAGGNHIRDLETLAAATEGLPADVHSIDLYAGVRARETGYLRHQGTVSFPKFSETVAASRFVIIPVFEDRHRATGITMIIHALMMGRPVIASSIAATRDYIRDGVNGLLVPPGDAKALREAIIQLDTDPAFLRATGEGATRTAKALSTETWAEELISGNGYRPLVHGGTGWQAW